MRDGQLITSRKPADLQAFNAAVIGALAEWMTAGQRATAEATARARPPGP